MTYLKVPVRDEIVEGGSSATIYTYFELKEIPFYAAYSAAYQSCDELNSKGIPCSLTDTDDRYGDRFINFEISVSDCKYLLRLFSINVHKHMIAQNREISNQRDIELLKEFIRGGEEIVPVITQSYKVPTITFDEFIGGEVAECH